MDKIFGHKIFHAEGITDAICTVDLETKSENLKIFLDEKHQRFKQYFSKHLKDRLQQYVVEPCMVEPTERNWSNNNAESICTKHFRNVKHYLQNNVGMEK